MRFTFSVQRNPWYKNYHFRLFNISLQYTHHNYSDHTGKEKHYQIYMGWDVGVYHRTLVNKMGSINTKCQS